MGRRKRGLFSLLIVHTVCLVYFPLFVFYWNTQCDPCTGDWSHFLHTLAQYVKSFRYEVCEVSPYFMLTFQNLAKFVGIFYERGAGTDRCWGY